jgi:DNA-binding transcriptional ArsR family regulator
LKLGALRLRKNGLSQTQAVLRALAEPRRVAILKLVGSRELRAGEISRQFRTTRPAISQHLRVLTKAGLLAERREGTRRFYRIRREGFAELRSFLDSFWTERLGVLKEEAEKEARSRRGL